MTALNKRNLASPAVRTAGEAGVTHQGGKGFTRDPRSELFLRATTMFAGEDAFYEKAGEADGKAVSLARDLAVGDWPWLSQFLIWLRSEANIRTMSVMLAAEAVHARLHASMAEITAAPLGYYSYNGVTNRKLIAMVLQRPDEPAELIAYWLGRYGKAVPKPLKRGVSDALARMLNQRQALRYDKPGASVRMGDVIEICHPSPRRTGEIRDGIQGLLFDHLIAVRHGREGYVTHGALDVIREREYLNSLSPDERHQFAHRAMTGGEEALRFANAMAGSWEWGKSWLGAR